MSSEPPTSPGKLFIVASPIGNLEDISARAARCISEVELVYAEDTRRSRVLLQHVGSSRPLRSLHEHNEAERVSEVVKRLSEGQDLALISDAGTPAISDPGARLIEAMAREGCDVVPIPGPSALTAALSVAGFLSPDTGVLFAGFVPSKGKNRRTAMSQVLGHRGIVVLFEAPHRISATLKSLAEEQPERRICVCREITKMHEETWRGTLEESVTWAGEGVRGELTLVLDAIASDDQVPDATEEEQSIDTALRACLEAGLSRRDAAAAVAAVLGLSKRVVYSRCQAL